jgi:hypothetical protein
MLIKNWGAAWALASLVVIAAIGFLFFDTPHCYSDKSDCISQYHYRAIYNNSSEPLDSVIKWVVDNRDAVEVLAGLGSLFFSAALALFTLVLASKTSGLYAETAGLRDAADKQRGDLLRSIKAAEDSARAAELSAEAAIGIELPRLFVSKIEFKHILINVDEIVVTITNYGRTPAFVFWQTCDFCVGPMLPTEPEYFNGIDVEPGTIIDTRQPYTMTARNDGFLSQFDGAPFIDGKQTIWVYGIVYFRDFLGRGQPFKFCAEYITVVGDPAKRGRFVQRGPPKYVQNPENDRGMLTRPGHS